MQINEYIIACSINDCRSKDFHNLSPLPLSSLSSLSSPLFFSEGMEVKSMSYRLKALNGHDKLETFSDWLHKSLNVLEG